MNYENSPQHSKYRFALSAVMDVGDRGAKGPPPPGKLNVRTGPRLAHILVPWFSVVFLGFSEWFPHSISFLNFYECWLVGPLQIRYHLAQTSSYTTGCNCTQCSLRSQNATLTKTYIPTSLHRPIITSHIVSYYVKWSLLKRCLSYALRQIGDWSH